MSNETPSWTQQEEAAFAQIMAAGDLPRIRAIQLYRRCKSRLALALQIARGETPARPSPATPAQIAALAKANAAKAGKASTAGIQLTLVAA